MKEEGYVALIVGKTNAYRIVERESHKEKERYEDVDGQVDGRIITKLTLYKYNVVIRTGLIWFRIKANGVIL
jgi:hypothetical protein